MLAAAAPEQRRVATANRTWDEASLLRGPVSADASTDLSRSHSTEARLRSAGGSQRDHPGDEEAVGGGGSSKVFPVSLGLVAAVLGCRSAGYEGLTGSWWITGCFP